MITLEIPRHLNDERLDSALALLWQEKNPEAEAFSRSFFARAIKAGTVLLNDKQATPKTLVATHDTVTLLDGIQKKEVSPEPFLGQMDLKVLFENEQFVVLDKGAGVQMHEAGAHGGATVAQWLLGHYPQVATVGEDLTRPGIVHRLDRDTSGVLVVAKEQKTFETLKAAFQNREVSKTYIALVYGHLKDLSGDITASLMRKPGALKRRAIDPEHYDGVLPGNTRTAFTSYRVLVRYAEYDLVELTPKTGRTHQIRVHLAYLGHPVVGDRLYAFKPKKEHPLLLPERHLLHATALSFDMEGTPYQFHSPLPDDFRMILESLDETREKSYDDEALKTCLPRFA